MKGGRAQMWRLGNLSKWQGLLFVMVVMFYPLVVHPVYEDLTNQEIRKRKVYKEPVQFVDERVLKSLALITDGMPSSWKREVMLANINGLNMKVMDVSELSQKIYNGGREMPEYVLFATENKADMHNILSGKGMEVYDIYGGGSVFDLRKSVLGYLSDYGLKNSNCTPKCYIDYQEATMAEETLPGETKNLETLLEQSLKVACGGIANSVDEADFVIVVARYKYRAGEPDDKEYFSNQASLIRRLSNYKIKSKPIVLVDLAEQMDEGDLFSDMLMRNSYLGLGDVVAYVGWGSKEEQLSYALTQAVSLSRESKKDISEETKKYLAVENIRLVILELLHNYQQEFWAPKILAAGKENQFVGEKFGNRVNKQNLLSWMKWKVQRLRGPLIYYGFPIGADKTRVRIQKIDVSDCNIYSVNDYDIDFQVEIVKD